MNANEDNGPPLPLEVSAAEANEILKVDPAAVLIDCRERSEYDLVHVAGGVLMPTSEFGNHVEAIQAMSNKRLLVMCHHGMRSMSVVQWLRQHGIENCQNVAGGIDAWACEVDSNLARY